MREVLTRDLTWKLFSLGLAVAIYFIVLSVREGTPRHTSTSDEMEERSFDGLPVVVFATAADVREFKVEPETVSVTVEGKREVLNQLTPADLRVLVDLTEIESAQDLIKRVEVSVPPGVRFVVAIPAEVYIVVPPKTESNP